MSDPVATPVEMVAVDGDSPQMRIIRHVRDAIRYGRLRPGQQLPLRDDFMRDFGVSNVTVQRAFARLIADGFVVAKASQGTFVAPRPPNLYRIGLVFNESKPMILASKYRNAIRAAAAAAQPSLAYTIETYYGIRYADGHDRDRLVDDVQNDRLAALIGSYDWSCWPKDPRMAGWTLPQVHWGSTPAPGFHTLRLTGFVERAVDEIRRAGARRVAFLTIPQAFSLVDPFLRAIQRAELESHPHWAQAVDSQHPEWIASTLRLLLPPDDPRAPDGLIVADDHLADHAVAALVDAGAAHRIKAVFHANFPVSSPLTMPGVRVGYDARELLDRSIHLLEQTWDADRQQRPRPVHRQEFHADLEENRHRLFLRPQPVGVDA